MKTNSLIGIENRENSIIFFEKFLGAPRYKYLFSKTLVLFRFTDPNNFGTSYYMEATYKTILNDIFHFYGSFYNVPKLRMPVRLLLYCSESDFKTQKFHQLNYISIYLVLYINKYTIVKEEQKKQLLIKTTEKLYIL